MPGQGERNSASFYKNLALWVIFGLVLILIFNAFNESQQSQSKIIFSQFLTAVEDGSIKQVTIKGNEIFGVYADGTRFRTYSPDDADLIELLTKKNVQIEVKPNEDSWLTDMFISMIPIILFIGVFLYLMQQMQGGGAKALSFGKSRAKQLTEGKQKATFEDVAGADEAKEELIEIIEFLKDPQKFQKLGGKIPKGVMLIGAPGTGKTLLARAVAGEAGVPFFTISGSDFVEMFVGVGASRVRDLFEQGKKNAPCIIFVDEIDAVGRHRGAGLGGGHDEREQTLNQLLVELDGFESNEGVIIIAATNRPDVLDPALLRPGRFDRQVVVSIPDVRGREGILAVHMKNVTISKDVDKQLLARGTPGFSGADLANLVNEAALLAARKKKPAVEMEDLEEAKDKVMMGRERRSLIISDDEKKLTAYHEAGHALVAKMLPGADPIHKVTIIPRGMSMGSTHYLPVDERHSYSKEYLNINIAVLLGGRAAEEVILNSLSNGASNDIERASDIARKMVCEWGMSEVLGPLAFGKKEEQIFLGKEFGQQQNYSEETAKLIDKEVKKIVIENYEKAKSIVTENKDKLKLLAEELLDSEILDGMQLDEILGITKKKDDKETDIQKV
ncbi:MAG: ATP-dependent zinc metalloprotease FtsH [bacterium]